jgi:UDP-N-acetylglucosamine 2-epimerase (non-hydrolysing)/GDP/UDP-N,N'-diacetylbacillosamine 2-epimerase (hydrolysing)
MRTIGVVTVARSDYGIYLPLLRRVRADERLRLHLIVSGMHLSPQYGLTCRNIEADGFEIAERVEMLLSSDTPEAVSKSMGLGVIGFSQAFARFKPDILVVLGDRFEMFAAALAALPFKIPVAHIHGGELTEGAIDDALRHGMTKLSHLHFVSTEPHAERVVQMGEEPWRVVVSGAPALDHLHGIRLLTKQELEARLGIRMDPPPLLVTFHPVTLEAERTEVYVEELLAAIGRCGMPVLFTMPNADTGNQCITRRVREFLETHPGSCWADNLGTEAYFSLMALSSAMVGNSSSGIIEAPSFCLPVVNVGTRQRGRTRAANVIDVGYGRGEIEEAIRRAVSPGFRDSLKGLVNPYGTGHAAQRILEVLNRTALDDNLLLKRFHDVHADSGR